MQLAQVHVSAAGEEDMFNVLNDPVVGRVKTGSKLLRVKLDGLAVFRVYHIPVSPAEARKVTAGNQSLQYIRTGFWSSSMDWKNQFIRGRTSACCPENTYWSKSWVSFACPHDGDSTTTGK